MLDEDISDLENILQVYSAGEWGDYGNSTLHINCEVPNSWDVMVNTSKLLPKLAVAYLREGLAGQGPQSVLYRVCTLSVLYCCECLAMYG